MLFKSYWLTIFLICWKFNMRYVVLSNKSLKKLQKEDRQHTKILFHYFDRCRLVNFIERPTINISQEAFNGIALKRRHWWSGMNKLRLISFGYGAKKKVL